MSHGSFRPRLAWVVAALVCLFVVPRPARADVAGDQVAAAIERGAAYLIRQQKDDGTWSEWPNCESGTVALCTLALLNSGVPLDDPAVKKALTYLRTRAPREKTYAVALQTMVYCAAKQDTDLGLIRKNVQWLEDVQGTDGGWGYSERGEITDNSNSQFALLALYEAERFSEEIKIDDEVWRRALDYWRRAQNGDGSWGYRQRGDTIGTGSMTCAGVTSVLIASTRRTESPLVNGQLPCCGTLPDGDSLERGLDWLGRNFSVDRNPNQNGWTLYYLYGLERVGRLTARRLIGRHDWYREGAEKLVHTQDPIGGFWKGHGNEETHTHIATSMALLFLAKGRRPVVMGKLRHGGPDWSLHPEDAGNLVSYVETKWKRDLTWQVVDPRSASVEDLLQVPVLYLSGRDAPQLTDEVLAKLRAYLDRGGFIFADACCDGKNEGFQEGFREAVRKMFKDEPQYQLMQLADSHPVWRIEEPIPAKYAGSLYGVNVSCRTSLIYCEQDVSCRWQYYDPRRMRSLSGFGDAGRAAREDIAGAVAVGLNVVAYATNREVKYKYEQFERRDDAVASDPFTRGQLSIAMVEHAGGSDAAPAALPNLERALAKAARVRVNFAQTTLKLQAEQIFDQPLLFMHGRTRPTLSEADRKQLRTYAERGGVLIADAICGSPEFANGFREEMSLAFPEAKLEKIPVDHPLYSNRFGGYELKTVQRREPRTAGKNAALRAAVRNVEPYLEGIKIGDRYVVIFSPYDISCALENHTSVECEGYVQDDALRIGVNAVLYGLYQPGP